MLFFIPLAWMGSFAEQSGLGVLRQHTQDGVHEGHAWIGVGCVGPPYAELGERREADGGELGGAALGRHGEIEGRSKG